MIPFVLLAQQDPADRWLEEHPEVLGGMILVAAVLNLLFAITILVIPMLILRKKKNLPTWGLLAIYSPGVTFLVLSLLMMLFATYLLLGGNPAFR